MDDTVGGVERWIMLVLAKINVVPDGEDLRWSSAVRATQFCCLVIVGVSQVSFPAFVVEDVAASEAAHSLVVFISIMADRADGVVAIVDDWFVGVF